MPAVVRRVIVLVMLCSLAGESGLRSPVVPVWQPVVMASSPKNGRLLARTSPKNTGCNFFTMGIYGGVALLSKRFFRNYTTTTPCADCGGSASSWWVWICVMSWAWVFPHPKSLGVDTPRHVYYLPIGCPAELRTWTRWGANRQGIAEPLEISGRVLQDDAACAVSELSFVGGCGRACTGWLDRKRWPLFGFYPEPCSCAFPRILLLFRVILETTLELTPSL